MAERITGHTELITLMAYPIRHSSSPAMHNEAFAKLGLDYAYLAFEVDNDTLEDAVKGLRALKVRGSNVSMPNKTEILKYLDKISPEAELCGAVNTVVNDDGILTGYNTDGMGCVMALKDNGMDPIGQKVTLAGAGGAATAIITQMALEGVKEICIYNIKDKNWDKAEALLQRLRDKTNCKLSLTDLEEQDKFKADIEDSYLFVNATGVGMKPLEGKAVIPDISYLRPDLKVFDVVYAPRETKLLQMAKEVGCQCMNGLGMMLFQGNAAFEKFTGHSMPIDYMKDILDIHYE